jgi:hypothetical protein
MNKSKSLSLVIFDTSGIELARRAVERSTNLFSFDDVLIFSDQPKKWGNFSIIEVKKITSLSDYNHAIYEELPQRLNTDFALIIQFDGFVLNPSSFTNFFYEFDYIGAPWPTNINHGLGVTVGNGGFSLRSKRLIQTLANYRESIRVNDDPEDVTICRYLRPMLEYRDNICFAPVEVARYFSVEFEQIKHPTPFGFHGLHRLPEAYKDDYKFLIDNLPDRCFQHGSYQLNNLKIGFSRLSTEAQKLFLDRLSKFN